MSLTAGNSIEFSLILRAVDDASDAIATIAKNLGSLTGVAEAAGLAVAAVGAIGVASVGVAAHFQTMATQIRNNTTMSASDIEVMQTAIKQLAAESNTPMDQLSQGFMKIVNYGYSAKDAVTILTQAMMSADSTGGDTAATGQVLANVMHEYGVAAGHAATYMDTLHQAAALGNSTLEDFVTGGGKAIAIAANLGVPLQDVSAALAALTRHGEDVAVASTNISGALSKIINPSKGARDELRALSQQSGVDLVSDFSIAGLHAKGLSGVMDDLRRATHGNTSEIFQLIPAMRGGQAAMILTGTGAADYRDILTSLNDTMAGKLTPTADSFARTQQNLGFQLGELWNKVQVLGVDLGTRFLPALTNVATVLNGAFQWGLNNIVPIMDGAGKALAAFATFVGTAVAPVVYGAIGGMTTFWREHGEQVRKVLTFVLDNLAGFGKNAGADSVSLMTLLSGIWSIGWNTISGIVTLSLDAMSGDWRRFAIDLNNIATDLADGIVRVFEWLVGATIRIIEDLITPINNLEHKLYEVTSSWAGGVYDAFASLPSAIGSMFGRLISDIPVFGGAIMKQIGSLATDIWNSITGQGSWDPNSATAKKIAAQDVASVTAHEKDTQSTYAQQRQAFIDTVSLGFRPDVSLSLPGANTALTNLHNQANAIITTINGKANLFGSNLPSWKATQSDTSGLGKHAFDDFLEKLGALTTSLGKIPGLGKDPSAPGSGGVSAAAMRDYLNSLLGDTAQATGREKITHAQDQFQLDMIQKANRQTLNRDARDVTNAMTSAGADSVAVKLEQARLQLEIANMFHKDQVAATKDLHRVAVDAYTNDYARLQLDEERHATVKTLQADITRVMRDYTAEGGHGSYDIQQHAEQLAQQAFGRPATLAKDAAREAIKQFEYDRQYGNAGPAALNADIDAVRKAMQGERATPLDIKTEIAQLRAELDKGPNATEAGAGRHYYGVNPRDLPGSGAGFGQSLVAFGSSSSAQADTLNILRQQLAASLRREARDERQIALLEAQLAAESRAADGIGSMLAGDAGGVHRSFKRAGIAHPIAR